MAETIYVLCALTSIACAVLLARSWVRQRQRILIWSTICFGALAVNNSTLFIDLVLYPQTSLLLWRNSAALIGLAALLGGLIWETE